MHALEARALAAPRRACIDRRGIPTRAAPLTTARRPARRVACPRRDATCGATSQQLLLTAFARRRHTRVTYLAVEPNGRLVMQRLAGCELGKFVSVGAGPAARDDLLARLTFEEVRVVGDMARAL